MNVRFYRISSNRFAVSSNTYTTTTLSKVQGRENHVGVAEEIVVLAMGTLIHSKERCKGTVRHITQQRGIVGFRRLGDLLRLRFGRPFPFRSRDEGRPS